MNQGEDINQDKISVTEHLLELRRRLIFTTVFFVITFVISYVFAEEIYRFLVAPLVKIYGHEESRRMIYTGLTEAFFTYIKVAFYAALFVVFPVFAMQLYLFLAPGLYKKEKKVLLPFLIACPLLFLAGGALVYYFIFPMAWSFFISFESSNVLGLPVQLEARVSEYLSLVISLIFAFGIAFQLPVLLMLLVKVGFLTSSSLKKKRRYAIVAIVAAAAILTPPDVISQIGLALALMALYELSIIACLYIEKERKTNA